MAKVNISNSQVVFSETKLRPYYNDFDESKNYMQILARPEFALQSREINQIQSILQNQIERFGQHIFVNGSLVLGQGINFQDLISLNIAPTYAGSDVDIEDFEKKTIVYSSNNDVQAYVAHVSEATDNDPASIYIRYFTGDEFGPGDTIRSNGTSNYANVVATSNNRGNALSAFVGDSVYFADGYFIKVAKQSIIASKYKRSGANVKIGLEKTRSIVTENEDSTLLDPAAEASNFDAPGANRFKFELNLAIRPLTDDVDEADFIELARYENGLLVSVVNKTQYAEIEEVLARRTYDESGNYTTKPFLGVVKEKDSDEVDFLLSTGKAYIRGYEYETIAETKLSIPKARTTANTIQNFDISMNYGNYVITDNVSGVFDTTALDIVDMHCVPISNVNYTSQNTYNTSKIGTARVVDMNFYGGDTDVAARKHEMYLTDTAFTTLSSNAAQTSAAINQIVFRSGTVSGIANAYQGVVIRILSGPAVGDLRTISDYNGTTRVATVSPEFTTLPLNNTFFRLEYTFKDVESFVKKTGYTTGATYNANANINILSKDFNKFANTVVISEPSLNKLVFAYPEKFIANGITNQSYVYRKKFASVSFTDGVSGAITAGADEDFEGITASSGIASTVMDNFYITVIDKKATARANGEQISASVVVSGNPDQAVFDTGSGAGDTFDATIFAKTEIIGTSAAPRVKTLVLANTHILSAGAANGTFRGGTGSNTSVYLTTGQVVIRQPTKRASVRESLYISDVQDVVKIYDLNGAAVPAAGANLVSYSDVTTRFEFQNGQKASYYDHASITLKPGVAAPKGPLIVCTRYYRTTTDFGYFNVDSYSSLNDDITEEGENIGTGYALIPDYLGTPLRDAIDFRPVRQNASNTTPGFSLGGTRIPVPVTEFQSDYTYYLGRRDLVIVSPNKALEVVSGTPSESPQSPEKPPETMLIYRLIIDPYTLSTANVFAEFVDNRRYTMKDIGLIDQRLKNVEYYVALNALEKSAVNLSIRDRNGLERSKFGILAENFTGHELGAWQQDDYAIAMDVNGSWYEGRATAEELKETIALYPVEFTNTIQVGNKIMLSYTDVLIWMCMSATKATPIAEFAFADYIGTIVTTPEADIWRDEKVYDVVTPKLPTPTNKLLPVAPRPPAVEDGDPDSEILAPLSPVGNGRPMKPAPIINNDLAVQKPIAKVTLPISSPRARA